MSGRGHLIDNTAVRLAAEGVPVAAIARALRRPAQELWPLFRDAIASGDLCDMPAADWPPGSRRTRMPAVAPLSSKDLDRLIDPLRALYSLTLHQARVLALIVLRRRVSRTDLHVALASPEAPEVTTHPKIVDVYICKVRKAIGADKIRTEWGRGYSMPREVSESILRDVQSFMAGLSEVSPDVGAFREGVFEGAQPCP